MKVFKLTFLLLLFFSAAAGQSISLEQIWQTYDFIPASAPGFNFLKDGKHYSRLEGNRIQEYDLTTGQPTRTLFDPDQISGFDGTIDSYHFSEDEEKILVKTETEKIYRRSSKAFFYVYDRQSKSISAIFEGGKQQYATFSPQADRVAFVFENDLYYRDLNTDKVIRVTNDGAANRIINGATDWVYEEEFAFAKAFQWSPDGQHLAFYRFDESRVKEFTMTNYRDELYPEYVTFKYPKVGEDNSIVAIKIYALAGEKTVNVDIGEATDIYIPRIKWTAEPGQLCVYHMNRHQNELQFLLADAASGNTRLLLRETNEYYIEEQLLDDLIFLENGKEFVWSSERDGWRHFYLYDMTGKLINRITSGEWEVSKLYGLDEERRLLYFQAAKESPLQREVYNMSLDGKRLQKMADKAGWNDAQFSSTFDYYVVTHSTANQPPSYKVFGREGNLIRIIEDNYGLVEKQAEAGVSPVEFFSFKTTQGVELNGWMIKPPRFQENRQYPVLMYTYGGPGSQTVTDEWQGQNYWWFQMLAQQGFVVASVDNRGTGGRGEAFKKMTYLELGRYETVDQIEAAQYLGSLPYTDKNRVGIFGWSYGGYLSSLCILKGNEAFQAAIAVAPVTNWKWYDTIYTERYMRTDEENPDGYRDNSPVYFADRLRGEYLLVHGMSDDNVHFQHTAEMANALISANKQFDTYFYPNRNHGIYGGVTRLHLYRKMTDFLNRKLKGNPFRVSPMKKPNRMDNRKILEMQKKPKRGN